jgi:hypothetical protein
MFRTLTPYSLLIKYKTFFQLPIFFRKTVFLKKNIISPLLYDAITNHVPSTQKQCTSRMTISGGSNSYPMQTKTTSIHPWAMTPSAAAAHDIRKSNRG